MTSLVVTDRDTAIQGQYAGFFSRLAGFAVDIFAIVIIFAVVGRVVEYLVTSVSGQQFSLSQTPVASDILLAVLAFLYCAYPQAMGGRTLGMALLGLRAVRRDGSDIGVWHAVARVLALPLSFLLLGIGFLMILIRQDRRALHDLIAKTAVVYDWGPSVSGEARVIAHS